MKIGIVGCGAVTKYYFEALGKDVEYVLCDINKPRHLPLKYIYFTDIKKSDFSKCGYIIVSTPPDSHLEISEFLLKNGRNIVVEKPACINRDELEKMRKLDLRYPKKIFLAYHTAHNLLFNHFKNLNLSHLSQIEVIYQEDVHSYHPFSKDWIFNSTISGGGCLIDSGINILSAIRLFCDQLKILSKIIQKRQYEVEDYTKIKMIGKDKNNNIINISIILDWINKDEKRIFNMVTGKNKYTVDLVSNKIFKNGKLIKSNGNLNNLDLVGEYKTLFEKAENYFFSKTSDSLYNSMLPLEDVFSIYGIK